MYRSGIDGGAYRRHLRGDTQRRDRVSEQPVALLGKEERADVYPAQLASAHQPGDATDVIEMEVGLDVDGHRGDAQ